MRRVPLCVAVLLAACSVDTEVIGGDTDTVRTDDTQPIGDDTDDTLDTVDTDDTVADTDVGGPTAPAVDVLVIYEDWNPGTGLPSLHLNEEAETSALTDALDAAGVQWRLGVMYARNDDNAGGGGALVASAGLGHLRSADAGRDVFLRSPFLWKDINDTVRALDALDAGLLRPTGDLATRNAGFHRSCAPLHVVVIASGFDRSQEDDVDTVTARLAALSPTGRASLSVITHDAPCDYPDAGLLDIAEATGGVLVDACEGMMTRHMRTVATFIGDHTGTCPDQPAQRGPVGRATAVDGTWTGTIALTYREFQSATPGTCSGPATLTIDGTRARNLDFEGHCDDRWRSPVGGGFLSAYEGLGVGDLDNATDGTGTLWLAGGANGLAGFYEQVPLAVTVDGDTLHAVYDGITGVGILRRGVKYEVELTRQP